MCTTLKVNLFTLCLKVRLEHMGWKENQLYKQHNSRHVFRCCDINQVLVCAFGPASAAVVVGCVCSAQGLSEGLPQYCGIYRYSRPV